LDSLVAYQALNDPRINMLKTGWNHDASLTVSGGSGQLTYSVTGSASSQTGYLHLPDVIAQVFDSVHGFAAPGWMKNPDAYTTYGGNSSLIVQLGQSGATLALTSQLFHSAQQQNSLENDLLVLQNTYVGSGAIRVGGPIDGTLGRAQATTLTSLFPDFYNKVQLNTITFSNALTLTNWSPWHWLPINATAGLSVRNTDNSTLLPRDYILGAFLGDFALSGAGGDTIGGYAFNRGSNTTQTLNASTTLASWQRVSTSIGINVNSSSASSFGAQTTGLPIGVSVPTSFIYTNGTGPSQSVFNSATYGWYVAPTLHLNDRFFASPGFRLDGGTGSGTHGGFSGGALSLFPKLDVSYVAVNRQPSDPMFGVLTLLRPRIAFGIAGVNPGPTETLRFLTPSDINPTVGGGTGIPIDVLNATTIGNTQLHPERSREFEGGADAQFWNNRLGITLTAYDKMRYDAIENIPVAPSIFTIGNASSYYANIGTVRNTGLEATITARLLDSRAVQWNINGNVSHNDNKFVKSTFQGGKVIVGIGEGTQNIDVPGYPLNSVWARPILGFDDSNSDGVIESNEVRLGDSVVYVGAQIPNYELTLNTSLGFFNNRLTVNTSIDVQDGLTQVMTPAGAGNECRDGSSCVYNQLNNPNTTLAQQAAFAAFSSGIGSGTGIGFVQTVNTLRWGTVSVNYVVPPAVSNFFRVHTMSIALQGSNLGLWTNYRGKDPNVNAFSSGNSTVDSGQLPRPRLWSLNFRLGN
jgi:outer membrane receptor protein involved in Fe transport